MRKRKFIKSTIMSFINQIIAMICSFIMPSMIISHYGSATNGLVNSITQFLAFFSLAEMGVGAVIRSSLYKPLADNDWKHVSEILVASKKFFAKIGFFLTLYCVGLMVYFSFFVVEQNNKISTMILVFSIALGSIANYLFGIVYQQLLSADQRLYITLTVSGFATVVNTVLGIILIKIGATIEMVELSFVFIHIIKPLFLKLYVDRHYNLDLTCTIEKDPIPQKWNGLAQHIAIYIWGYADTIILTFMSTLENVSVYSVYHLVTNGLKLLIELASNSMNALLGDMYARREAKVLNTTFERFEFLTNFVVTFLFCVASIMIVPFVSLYTSGVNDANYVQPIFSKLILLAVAMYCYRTPYTIMVLAAGHFKETQNAALIEAVLNIVISVALVKKYGLIGVAIGTFVAVFYRTLYLVLYLKKNILYRSPMKFIKYMFLNCICFAIVFFVNIDNNYFNSWYEWIKWGILSSFICFVMVGLIYFLFNSCLSKIILNRAND